MIQKYFSVAGTVVNQLSTLTITDTKLYVPIVTLSTQDNAKQFEQLIQGFKRTINWNKYKSEIKKLNKNRHLDFLIDSSFQGANRVFVLSFGNEDYR